MLASNTNVFILHLLFTLLSTVRVQACDDGHDSHIHPRDWATNAQAQAHFSSSQSFAPGKGPPHHHVAISPPSRPLPWGDINILHTTDSHGWLLGHQKKSFPEPNYSGDLGEFYSFVERMGEVAEVRVRYGSRPTILTDPFD
jgi:2',3'-cyclic-nucleotide 2'-phosphodiesterase (5'-nucleotidase family)